MNLVGVITNPRSTRNVAGLDRIRDVVEEFDGVFHFEINDISDISLALRRFAEQGVDVIALNGGDGTIQAAFSYLLKERPFTILPPIAVLPAGKTNMIAEDLGAMSPKPHVYLRRLLKNCAHDEVRLSLTQRKIMKIEGVPAAPELGGMFLGTAGIVRGIEFCRQVVYPLGLPNFLSHPLAVGLLLIGTLVGRITGRSPLETPPISLETELGREEQKQYFVITATTLNRLLLGLRPFGVQGEGGIRLLAVPSRPSTVLRTFWRTVRGVLAEKPVADVIAVNVDDVRIRLNSPLTVDGELYDVPPDAEIRITATESMNFVHFGAE